MRTLRFAFVASAIGLCVHCGDTTDSATVGRIADSGPEAARESGARVATDASGSWDAKESDASNAAAEAAVDGLATGARGGDTATVCGTGACDAGQVCVTFSGSIGGPGDPGSPAGSSSGCADIPSSCTDYCKCQSLCDPDSSLIVCHADGLYLACGSIAP